MFQQKALDGGVELIIDTSRLSVFSVIGDELRISQVIINIVSNALKFTPSGGQVKVEFCHNTVSRERIILEIVISDTGIGMDEDFRSRMFLPFEQAQAATARQYGGTGLGLAISYNYVKMMSGDIIVHSSPGEGSEFIVQIPLKRPAFMSARTVEKTEEIMQKNDCDLTGTTVLLVEDNALNSEIVATLLESSGAEVELAWNGEEAVEKVSASPEGKYKLVLMDIQMPGMGGLEATRMIRSLKRADAESIVIIGLSANAFSEDIDRAHKSGMNGYLSKPIDLVKLFEVIRR